MSLLTQSYLIQQYVARNFANIIDILSRVNLRVGRQANTVVSIRSQNALPGQQGKHAFVDA